MSIHRNVTREMQATLTVFVAGESPHDATLGDLEAACEAAGLKLEGEGWRLLHQCGSMCGYDILPGSPPITDLVRELRRKYDERGVRIAGLERDRERDAALAEVERLRDDYDEMTTERNHLLGELERMRPVVDATRAYREWSDDDSLPPSDARWGMWKALDVLDRAAKPENAPCACDEFIKVGHLDGCPNAPPSDGAPDRVWCWTDRGCPGHGEWMDTPGSSPKTEYLSRAYHDRLVREALERAADAGVEQLQQIRCYAASLGEERAMRAAILEDK
jgi:hypothetical protein